MSRKDPPPSHSRFVHAASSRHDGDTCDSTDIRIEKPGVVLLWKRTRIKHNAEHSMWRLCCWYLTSSKVGNIMHQSQHGCNPSANQNYVCRIRARLFNINGKEREGRRGGGRRMEKEKGRRRKRRKGQSWYFRSGEPLASISQSHRIPYKHLKNKVNRSQVPFSTFSHVFPSLTQSHSCGVWLESRQ